MTQPQPKTPQDTNGTSKLLSTLAASGDKMIQFGVLVLVGISGLGNWFATQNTGQQNLQGQERIRQEVRQQINDVHDWIAENRKWIKQSSDEFHQGNADSAANREILRKFGDELLSFENRQLTELSNQTKMLANQNQQMENDTKILDAIHRAVAPLEIEKAYPSPSK